MYNGSRSPQFVRPAGGPNTRSRHPVQDPAICDATAELLLHASIEVLPLFIVAFVRYLQASTTAAAAIWEYEKTSMAYSTSASSAR